MNKKLKKSLGQHLLTNEKIAEKIVESLIVNSDKNILEIGSGNGVLTKYLLKKDIDLWAVEIDKNFIKSLSEKFPSLKKNLIEGDVLKMDFRKYFSNHFSIIGNFPYNISSQIFFKILENKDIISQVVCMLQLEVAERICSSHGSKKYGILSVLLQAFYNIEFLFSVDEKNFYPRPKVKSALIRLTRNKFNDISFNKNLFYRIVKSAFNKRRKMLRNSLKNILEGYNGIHPFFTLRPEQLSVQDFISLARYFDENIKK